MTTAAINFLLLGGWEGTGLLGGWEGTGLLGGWEGTGLLGDWEGTSLLGGWEGTSLLEETKRAATAFSIIFQPHLPLDYNTKQLSVLDHGHVLLPN